MDLQNMESGVSVIADAIKGLNIDLSGTEGQEVDEEVLEWYKSRFKMFEEDNTLLAINVYLEKLQADKTVNEITRVYVMKEATETICRGGTA